MYRRHGLVIAAAIGLLVPLGTSAAVVAWTDVPVRIYDRAGLSAATTQAALALAAATLASASLEVRWRLCVPSARSATTCDAPLRAGERVIRILHAPRPESRHRALPLGEALIDTETGTGVLATIYFDRVTALADATRSEVPPLLGRAIAHELGHLLLASNAHSTHGLMRAIWSREELRRGTATDWAFTAGDVTAMRARAER